MRIQPNTILRWESEEGKPRFERVLYADPGNYEIWTIDVDHKRALPIFYKYEDLQHALLSNRTRIIVNYEPYILITLPDEELGEEFFEYIKHRDKAWEIIQPLVEVGIHKLFNRKERGRLITELAKHTKHKKHTFYFHLRRYWQRGCVKNALFPDWHNCGSVKDRKDHGNKRGRPSTKTLRLGQPTGRNVTPQDEEYFRGGINEFKIKGGANLPSTWQMIKEQYYSTGEYELSDGLEGQNLVPVLLPPGEIPTFEQFKYFYYKTRNPSQEIIIQEGQNEYDRNVRPVLDDSTKMAFGPGAVYQIDATVGDIYLVNDLNREHLIGRPVIYIVIDTFSRLIVGFAVTLEGPSWAGAKIALENAFMNKVEFCAGLGINITEDKWPVQGLCESLLGDNGEIKGYNANSLVNPMGIRVSNAAVFRPDWKAIVERNFRTTKGLYVDFIPGVVRPRRKVRGQDYRLEARLSLLGFRQLMAVCVLHYNNSYYIKDYPMDPHMIQMKVKPIPSELWQYGMEHLTGRLQGFNHDRLLKNLLPTGRASVRRDGIYFNGLSYTCEMAIRERWFDRIAGKRTFPLAVVYESIVDRIHLRLSHGKLFETCHLTPADKRFEGKDWYEMREYFAWKLQQEKNAVTELQQTTAEFHAQLKRLVSDEAKETDQAMKAANLSNRARTQNIRDSRNQLKRHERKYGSLSYSKLVDSSLAETSSSAASKRHLVRPPASDGYVPPAKPIDEIRAARERARGRK
jgi:putative transposase